MGLLDMAMDMLGGAGRGDGAAPGGGQADLLRLVAMVLSQLGQQQGGAGGAGGLGGLGALVEQFGRGGLGDVVSSWVGTGHNLPVSPEQLGQVFGPELLERLTQQSGMPAGDLLGQLSQVLPQAVDQMTPQGRLPDDGGLGEIGAILNRFG